MAKAHQTCMSEIRKYKSGNKHTVLSTKLVSISNVRLCSLLMLHVFWQEMWCIIRHLAKQNALYHYDTI